MASGRLKGARRETWEDGPVVDILSRLPVKSICSFKTVCKSWNRLTSNKDFAKKHFAISKKNQDPSFISCPSMDTMKFYSTNLCSLRRLSLRTMVPDERCHQGCMYMISSFNGLICAINLTSEEETEESVSDLQIWICNPCTGETLLLPQGTPSCFEVVPSVGVAYASDTSDYRVFRIFCTGEKIPKEKVTRHVYRNREVVEESHYVLAYACEVYSSLTGSWETIAAVSCVPMHAYHSPFSSSHVFVGGKVYWLVSLDAPGKILSVDLEGRVEYLVLPTYSENQKGEDQITDCTYLIDLKGSLSLVVLHPCYFDLWVQDSSEEDGWGFVFSEKCPIKDDEMVLAVTSLENKIIWLTETHWRIFDVDSKKWRRKKAASSRYVNPSVFPFTESLLTCEGGEMLL